MYPSETAWFIKEYEEAVRRPYGYLFVALRPTTLDRCRLRTNVLPGEERFDKGFEEHRISQLLRYLKQQTLMVPPPISWNRCLQLESVHAPSLSNFVTYLDPEPKRASRPSRRLHRTSPYKYSQYDTDDKDDKDD